MKPDNSNLGGDVPARPADSATSPSTPTASQQQAAANIARSQLDHIYGGNATAAPQQQQDTSPYHRTHTDATTATPDQWKEYHSAWQNYYQQYYENYYHHAKKATEPEGQHHYFTQQPAAAPAAAQETLSNDEALFELRQTLLGKVQASAKKIRKSRHFIPITAAVVVVLLFVFLQYNRVIFANVAAYVSPGSIDPQNIVIDPSSDISVGQDPRLIIPKINVDVPVMYDVGNDHASQMKAMESGVAHFAIPGANSHPGEIGNAVIAGHSSNDLFDIGDYKFIFAQLEKLAPGDTMYAHYQGKRYTYLITKMETVRPNEVSKLIYATDKPVMTLITCTPLGTALNRLLVTAEQISPDPAQATSAPDSEGSVDPNAMPGNSPTIFERLFGAR